MGYFTLSAEDQYRERLDAMGEAAIIASLKTKAGAPVVSGRQIDVYFFAHTPYLWARTQWLRDRGYGVRHNHEVNRRMRYSQGVAVAA